jgi:hypothetical protein
MRSSSAILPAEPQPATIPVTKPHAHMVAIYAVWCNWIRIHKTLRVTPAMATGLSKTLMDWSDIIEAIDAEAPKPGPRGPYKRQPA